MPTKALIIQKIYFRSRHWGAIKEASLRRGVIKEGRYEVFFTLFEVTDYSDNHLEYLGIAENVLEMTTKSRWKSQISAYQSLVDRLEGSDKNL